MSRTHSERPSRPWIRTEEVSSTFSAALREDGLIDEDDTDIVFHDLSFLSERITELKAVFPDSTLHTVALKANPLTALLLKTLESGLGVEVASLPELYLAERAGFPPSKIVFDSPAKTMKELEHALRLGVSLNVDSFAELKRIDALLKVITSTSLIGLRINPQVAEGRIRSTGVAGRISKFGIPLDAHREEILECYSRYDWLKGIHVHIGSQGYPVELLGEGIKRVVGVATRVNSMLRHGAGRAGVEVVDIGGGLPVSYRHDSDAISMQEYAGLLRDKVGVLFSGEFRLMTEFGRYLHANAGWAASRVEYVKRERDHNIIMTHVGADLLVRKCLNPDDWHHEITVVDRTGRVKTGQDANRYMVAGPLCFSGDVIGRDLALPAVEEGDYILVHDIGAYTLSMWSRYNSRQMPKVIGYYGGGEEFEVLRAREKEEDLFKFWS